MPISVMYTWVRYRMTVDKEEFAMSMIGAKGPPVLKSRNTNAMWPSYVAFRGIKQSYMVVIESVNGRLWTCQRGFFFPSNIYHLPMYGVIPLANDGDYDIVSQDGVVDGKEEISTASGDSQGSGFLPMYPKEGK